MNHLQKEIGLVDMRVLMIFIDGFGLGERDETKNPYVRARTPTLDRLLGGHCLYQDVGIVVGPLAVMLPTDTTLGVPGLPQSATGQTTLWTGINAAQVVGYHVNAYPTKTLRELLSSHSIFKVVTERGKKATFANAFRPQYFELAAQGKARNSTSTQATLSAGLPLRTFDDLAAGNAIYQDITNELLRLWGFDLPLIEPELAGTRLARIADDYDFTLFEYFQSDRAGHRGDLKRGMEIIELLDRFLGAVIAETNLSQSLIIVTSDHGNLEDISVETHTLNPVPTILIQENIVANYPVITSLTQINDYVLQVIDRA